MTQDERTRIAMEKARWARNWRATGPILAARRFLANWVSLRALRLAHTRAAPLRVMLGIVVGVAWLSLGLLAAADHVRANVAGQSVRIDPPEALLLGSANAVCIVRSGKECDFAESNDWRVVTAQTSFTILALVSVLFGFWTQLLGAFAHAMRAMGAGHVIVTGEGVAAEALARDVARRGRRRRKAAVLVRRTASAAEVEALAADGVALVAGAPSDRAVLRGAGVTHADRVVAISESDSENLGVAAAARDERGGKLAPGDVLVRLEDGALRRDLPASGQLRVADMFSLPEVAARHLLGDTMFLDAAKRQNQTGVHLAIVGWSTAAQALATRAFRLLWAPEFNDAPRVSVITTSAAECAEAYRALHQAAFDTSQMWNPDIAFIDIKSASTDPGPLLEEAGRRGPLTAIVVSWPDDRDTMHSAALVVRRAHDKGALVVVHESKEETIAASLSSPHGARVHAFASPRELLSAALLVDRAADRAAERLHGDYIVTCVLGQHEEAYKQALRTGRGLTRALRLLRRAPEHDDLSALENDFAKTFGARAFARLRSGLTQTLLERGAFKPRADRPAQRPWTELREVYITGNRTGADHALYKLWQLGWRRAAKTERGAIPGVEPERITLQYCEREHQRWCADTLLSGYRLGPRDEEAMLHPDLKPYADFAPGKERDEAIAKDRDPWLVAPNVAGSQ
jgi:voltage-gated potassium channel Kch